MKLPVFGLGQEISYFIEQLSMLLASGMPVNSALSAISQELKNKQLKSIIEEIEKDIDAGLTISASLDKAGIFPAHIISLIKIGEESGRLPENLKVIALTQEKERDFRSKVVSAMMYPVFVFSLTAVVGIGIAWFILPRLALVFSSIRLELPLITRALIVLGNFLGQYGFFVIPFVITLGLLLSFFIFLYPKTNYIGQAILFRVPAVGKLFREMELARFGYILGSLFKVGLPITDALASLADATTLYRYKNLYIHLRRSIEEGNSFQKSFALYKRAAGLIPVTIQQLIITSEQSGRLPETLIKIGEMYEEKTETTTKNVTVLLEPILLVIVWLGVVAVALAVILPLYSLIGGLNR